MNRSWGRLGTSAEPAPRLPCLSGGYALRQPQAMSILVQPPAASRVVPEHLLSGRVFEILAVADIDRVREARFRVRVVRAEHEHVVAPTSWLTAFTMSPPSWITIEAKKRPPVRCSQAVFFRSRAHITHVVHLVVRTAAPKGYPAETTLKHGHTQIRVAIHDAGTDQRGDEAHSAPGVR